MPIFTRSFDLLTWLLPMTQHFPRAHRHGFTRRLLDSAFDGLEHAVADTFTNLLVHIIFSTKNREPLIQEPLRERLYEYIGGIIRKDGGTQLEIGGMPDHVHVLARIKADVAVSEALRSIKAGSSKWVHDAFREHRREGVRSSVGTLL